MTRALRWGFGGCAALVLLVGAMLGYLLGSQGGPQLLRGAVLDALGDVLRGEARIGAIEGPLYRRLVLRDLEIEDAEGRTAVAIGAIELDYDLSALADDALVIEALRIRRPRIYARQDPEQGLNLARLARPSNSTSEASDTAPGLPLAIELRELALSEGSVQLTGAGTPLALDGIALNTSLKGRNTEIELPELTLGLFRRQVLRLRDLRFDLETLAAELALALTLSPEAIARLLGDPAWRGAVSMDAEISHSDAGVAALRLDGEVAGAALALSAGFDAADSSGRVNLALGALDPSALHGAAPPGRLSLELKADAEGLTSAERRVRARVGATGVVRMPGQPEVELVGLRSAATLSGDRIEGRSDARIGVREGEVTGEAVVSAKVSGALEAPQLRASLRAPKLRLGGRDIEDLSLDVGLRRSVSGALTVLLERLGVVVGGLRWDGHSARVELSPARELSVRGLKLASPAGRFSVEADVALDGLPKGPVRADLRLERAELQVLNRSLGLGLPAPRGVLSGDVHVELGTGDPDLATLALTGTGLSLRGARGVSLELTTRATGGRGELGLTTTGGAELNAEAKLRIPRRLGNVEGWKKLRPRHLEGARVELERLELGWVDRLAGSGLGLAGDVAAAFEVDGKGRLRGNLQANRVKTAELDVSTTTALEIAQRGKRLRLRARTRLGRREALDLALRFELPRKGLRGLAGIATAPLQIQGRLQALPLEAYAPLYAAALPEGMAPSGQIGGEIELTLRDRKLRGEVALHAQSLRPRDGAPATDLHLQSILGDGTLGLRLQAAGAGLGKLRIEGDAQVPAVTLDVAAWKRLGPTALRALELDARALRVASLAGLAGVELPADAVVEGQVHVAPGLRSADIALRAKDITVGEASPSVDARVDGSWDEGGLTLDAELSERARLFSLSTTVELPIAVLQQPPETLESAARSAALQAQLKLEAPLVPRLRTLFAPTLPLAGAVTGQIDVSGSAKAPIAQVALRGPGLTLAGVPLGDLSIDAEADGERATAALRLALDDQRALRLDARLPLQEKPMPLDVTLVAASYPLQLPAPVLPSGALGGVEGVLDGQLQLGGSVEDPRPGGKLRLRDMRLLLVPPLPTIEKARIDLDVDAQSFALQLEGSSGTTGKVSAQLRGRRDGAREGRIEGDLKLADLVLVAGSSVIGLDLDARLNAEATASGVEAELRLEDGAIRVPGQSAVALHPVREHGDVVYLEPGAEHVADADGGVQDAESAVLNMRVRTGKPLTLRGEEIDAVVEVDLRVLGGARGSALVGEISVGNGWVRLFDRRWDIDRARLIFDGPPEPRLDLMLQHAFETATVRVGVEGTPQRPRLRLSSDPPRYTEQQLLSFVVGGSPDDEGGQAPPELQAASAAAALLLGPVQRAITEALPIDTLRVEAGRSSAIGSLLLGRWITSRIFVAYRYRLQAVEGENINEAVVQYRVLQRLMLETRYGDRDVGSADLLWRKRF